jgi:hypothetical protein
MLSHLPLRIEEGRRRRRQAKKEKEKEEERGECIEGRTEREGRGLYLVMGFPFLESPNQFLQY